MVVELHLKACDNTEISIDKDVSAVNLQFLYQIKNAIIVKTNKTSITNF